MTAQCDVNLVTRNYLFSLVTIHRNGAGKGYYNHTFSAKTLQAVLGLDPYDWKNTPLEEFWKSKFNAKVATGAQCNQAEQYAEKEAARQLGKLLNSVLATHFNGEFSDITPQVNANWKESKTYKWLFPNGSLAEADQKPI